MKKILSLVILLLCGCATQVVSSSQNTVIVESQMLDAAQAQKLADAECSKYGRTARMTSKGGYWERNYIFECLK